MSDPNVKGVKKLSSRSVPQTSPSAKSRKLTAKATARAKPVVKRSAAEKAPARKATKARSSSAKPDKSGRTAKSKPKKKAVTLSRPAQAKKAVSSKITTNRSKRTLPKTKNTVATKLAPSKPTPKRAKTPTATAPPSQTSRDEAAALRAFERAHKEFTRGRFSEARSLFRSLIEQHAGAAEVAARARTYLAIIETRLRTENSLPRDADALYDRGVLELNRGEYVAAQEMFERALKRDPGAAHIHYGLASARARLGSVTPALESLERALNLQPTLRLQAQRDQDLALLRTEPDFERLVFAVR